MSMSVEPERVRAQLEKILTSAPFSRSGRLRRFLRYLVEIRLCGRLELLRELPLGMDVFERGTDFDPRLDPIVRIDARRLRARLTEYYEGPGAFDEIEVVLERGGYVPSFRVREYLRSARRSVAILPFEGWSAAADSRHFGKVLTEELVSVLGQVPGWRVRVCPENGLAPAQGAPDVIVRGGSTRSAESLRVAVNLVRGSDGSLLVSQRFQRDEGQARELLQEVIEYVVAQLGGGDSRSNDREALYLYLQGRYLMNQNTPEALHKAVACFEKVVMRDPHSSRAWSGMAAAIGSMILLGAVDPAQAVPKAAQAAAKALESEPHLPEVRTAAAIMMALLDGEIGQARLALESVLDAHPHFVAARIARAAYCLLPQGDFNEAKAELEIALAADPTNPSSLYCMSLVHCAERSFDSARQTLEAILKISTRYPACWRQLSEVHRQMGNGQEALAAYQRYEQLSPAPQSAPAAAPDGGPEPRTTAAAAQAAGSTVVFS